GAPATGAQAERDGIEGLLELAEADVAEKARIVFDQALAPGAQAETIRARITDPGLGQVFVVRIGHHRIARAAVAGGVEILAAEVPVGMSGQAELPARPFRTDQARAGAQRRCRGVFAEAGVIDQLEAIAKIE